MKRVYWLRYTQKLKWHTLLQAIIGTTGTLSNKDLGGNTVALEQGFEILLFTTEFSKQNNFGILPFTDENSNELPDNIKAFCKTVSLGCKIAYVEAEYFGGSGAQASMVFEDANPELHSRLNSEAINLALKSLGVKAKAPLDEFDSLGLGKKRHTNKW